MPTTIDDFQKGDVVRYQTLDRPDRWCREGYAVAMPPRWRGSDETVVLHDTYWSLTGDQDDHVLTPDEVATAELLFSLEAMTAVDGRSEFDRRTKWERYAPADRFLVTSQHGLTPHFFVRTGAEQSRAAELEQQRLAVEEALRKRDLALHELQFQRERYHQMLADPTVRPWAV